MARQLTEILELERECDDYRESLSLVKLGLQRVRSEYFVGAVALTSNAIEEIEEELETLALTIESALF